MVKSTRKLARARRKAWRESNMAHVEKCLAMIEEVRKREIPLTVTKREILAARTRAGGWTRETLAQWGVSWPPRAGWIDRLINGVREEIWDDPEPDEI